MGPSETRPADAYPQAPASPSFPSPPRPRCAPASPRVFRDRVKAEGKVRPARRAVSPARRSPPPLERALAEDRLSNSEATILKAALHHAWERAAAVLGVRCLVFGTRGSGEQANRNSRFEIQPGRTRTPNPESRTPTGSPGPIAPSPEPQCRRLELEIHRSAPEFPVSNFDFRAPNAAAAHGSPATAPPIERRADRAAGQG